jgi:hypothetical protein
MSCQNLKFHKVSKGEQDYSLKFPLEVIFRTRNYGTLSLAFLSCHDLFESPVELAPCCE